VQEDKNKIKLPKFDPTLFEEERSGLLMDPEKVLEEAGISEGEKVADFGCGIGFYTIPAAKKVGERGIVFALDVNKDFLDVVKSKATYENLSNIKTILIDLEKVPLNLEEPIDWVLVIDLLYQVQDKEKIFEQAKRILSKDGKVLLIEWKKEETPLGPPVKDRVSKEELLNLIKKYNFQIIKEFDVGRCHKGYILTF